MYPNFFTLNIPPQQALRSLAASDTLSAPCVEPSTGEYRGWVTCSGLLSQLLRHAYPRLTSPDLISQEDVDAFLWELPTADDTHPVVDDFGKSRKKSSLCDLLKEDEEKSESEGEGKTDMVSSPTFKSLASDAQTQTIAAIAGTQRTTRWNTWSAHACCARRRVVVLCFGVLREREALNVVLSWH